MRIEGLSFRKELVKTLRLIPKAVREYLKPKDNSPIGELLDGYGYGGCRAVSNRQALKHQIKTLKVSARRKHPEVVVRTLRILNATTPNREDIEFVYNYVVDVLGGELIYGFNYMRKFYMDFYEDYGLTLHVEDVDNMPSVGIDANTHLVVDKSHVYLLKSVKSQNLTREQLNGCYRRAYWDGIDVYGFDRYLVPTHIFEKSDGME